MPNSHHRPLLADGDSEAVVLGTLLLPELLQGTGRRRQPE